jgi:hypothetical protein
VLAEAQGLAKALEEQGHFNADPAALVAEIEALTGAPPIIRPLPSEAMPQTSEAKARCC